jgi:hypothetical protein
MINCTLTAQRKRLDPHEYCTKMGLKQGNDNPRGGPKLLVNIRTVRA